MPSFRRPSSSPRLSVLPALAALILTNRHTASAAASPRRENRLLTDVACLDEHCAPTERGQPEAGVVRWATSLTQARAEAEASGKPIFVQFTEIPGGQQTAQDYGRDVLSHPVLADLIEEAFVPCLVNSRGGGENDAALEFFGEATTGGPAVRFVDAERRDLAPRFQCSGGGGGDLRDAAAAVFRAAADALTVARQPLPPFARLMGPVGAAAVIGLGMESEWLVFTVDSFHSAEAVLGALPAALSTEAGWCGGTFQKPPRLEQAVRVEFDSSLAGAGEVVTAAMALGYSPADERTAQSFRSAKPADQKHCLRASITNPPAGPGGGALAGAEDLARALARVSLTPTQAMRANAACFRGAPVGDYPALSPRQVEQQKLATRLQPGRRTHAPKHNEDL
jgi:hypothetical protein